MSSETVAVKQGQTWQHVKRGTTYEVIGVAELQAGQLQAEHAELVIYRGEDGKLWARNSGEFTDGRFTRQQAEARATSGAGDESSITDAEVNAALRHGFGERVATAVLIRDRVAGMIALAGLGTNTGEPRRPHDSWQADEFETRIMDIVPTRVVDQCYSLADRILAAVPASPTEAPGSEGAGEVERLRMVGSILAGALERIASRDWNSKPDAVAIADAALNAASTRLALNEQEGG